MFAIAKFFMLPRTWLTNRRPSVIWRCWLGNLTRKIVPETTYNVSSGTLNPTIPYPLLSSAETISWRSAAMRDLLFDQNSRSALVCRSSHDISPVVNGMQVFGLRKGIMNAYVRTQERNHPQSYSQVSWAARETTSDCLLPLSRHIPHSSLRAGHCSFSSRDDDDDEDHCDISYVLDMIRSQLKSVDDARVQTIQFVNRNTIHATQVYLIRTSLFTILEVFFWL